MRRNAYIVVFILAAVISVHSYGGISLAQHEIPEGIFPESVTMKAEKVILSMDDKEVVEKELGDGIQERVFTFYIGTKGKDIQGYALTVTEMGKHGPMRFLIMINTEGRIKRISLLENREIRGAKIGRKRFLRQFAGKGPDDPVRLRSDIDAVTGATVSSKAAARAVRKALIIWEVFYGEGGD